MAGEQSQHFRDDTEKYHDHGIHLKDRLIYLGGDIEEEMSNDFIKNMNLLDTTSDAPINIDLQSCGGDEEPGWAIYDRIRRSRCHVTITLWGQCSSMATIIAQAADERLASQHTLLVFHEGKVDSGEMHPQELKEFTKNVIKDLDRMYDIYSQCTGLNRTELEKFCTMDKYADANLAQRMGFICKVLRNPVPKWLQNKRRREKRNDKLNKK